MNWKILAAFMAGALIASGIVYMAVKDAPVVAKLAAYGDMGVEEFICWFMDVPSTRSMELLATQVLPRLGARRGVTA